MNVEFIDLKKVIKVLLPDKINQSLKGTKNAAYGWRREIERKKKELVKDYESVVEVEQLIGMPLSKTLLLLIENSISKLDAVLQKEDWALLARAFDNLNIDDNLNIVTSVKVFQEIAKTVTDIFAQKKIKLTELDVFAIRWKIHQMKTKA